MAKTQPVTPNQLAESLAGSANRVTFGKRVRSFLRTHYPRDVMGVGWVLTAEQVAAVTAWHKARTAGKPFDFAAWRKSYRSRSRKPAATAEQPDA